MGKGGLHRAGACKIIVFFTELKDKYKVLRMTSLTTCLNTSLKGS